MKFDAKRHCGTLADSIGPVGHRVCRDDPTLPLQTKTTGRERLIWKRRCGASIATHIRPLHWLPSFVKHIIIRERLQWLRVVGHYVLVFHCFRG